MTIIIGAEARVTITDNAVIKERLPKRYRNETLDDNIRKKRTRNEAAIIRRLEGIKGIPRLLDSTKYSITTERIMGEPLSKAWNRISIKESARGIALIIREMHKKNIVHGDITPRNIIIGNDKTRIIDYGLSMSSHRIEDKANDLWMTRETFIMIEGYSDALIKEYLSLLEPKEKELFTERLNKMSMRGRHRAKKNN
ncbi:MAG: KEOPS complex kinase/ATPase Bud32 [Candidatus Woesearchaeota archaeon]